jgi:hypothetical protein
MYVQVEAVIGVHNGASSAINITAIAGSLNNAKAFSQHFQNFTAQATKLTIVPSALAYPGLAPPLNCSWPCLPE